MEIGKVRVQGLDLVAHANTDGRWWLTEPVEGEERQSWRHTLGSGDTLEAAKREARKTLKKREVEVAVTFKRSRIGGYGSDKSLVIEEGVARGMKAGDTSTALVTIKGKREQIKSSYSDKSIWRPDTPDAKVEKHRALEVERNRLYREQREIEDEWNLDLSSAVREAIDSEAELAEEQEPDEIAPVSSD